MSENAPGSTKTLHRSLGDRLRTGMYLTRLDWHLEAVMPGKERRSTLKELRQTLAGDPRGTHTSLHDLGSPKALAEQYAGDTHRRPLLSIGVIFAGAALLIYWTVFLSYAFGMLAALESTGSTEAEARFFTVDVTAYSTAEAFGIGWSGDWSWLVVPTLIAAIAFLLGARSWRAISRTTTGS
ncbi:hypothetical protein IWX63_003104 [Arthrobacter sp. CAN_A2]|uniref:hypothetical protein n=1 Tax=Arthrobacter sp. CAN_A2 TaxID=2787718 RepID=UPI001A276583